MPDVDPTPFLGKTINQICGNGFHDPTQNHCAHFVSHVLGLDFSLNCKSLAGGNKPAGNVRVQEIFPKCPKVGKWADADLGRTQLIFVTLASNVDLPNKTMINIPKKHVGIFHKGKVFHYGNTHDKVVEDTPQSFQTKFNATYGPGQGYFFGHIPGEDLLLNIHSNGAAASAQKKFDLIGPVAGVWRAKEVADAQDFLVGREVNQPSKKFFGINIAVASYWGPVFKAEDYVADFDHWACLLEVTGVCESQNRFNLINSYDRAKFTYGFYQLAAHTPRDNLILLFHALAKLPKFKAYFPDLAIKNGRLTRVDSSGTSTDLETEFDTGPDGEINLQLFMNYLNPNRKLIDEQEVLMAARLIHWTVNDPAVRKAQVQVSAAILQSKMAKRYQPKLGLDGKSDVVCAIVSDIFHQGRSTFAEVRAILSAAQPEQALLSLHDADFAGRNRTLRKAIEASVTAGKLGTRRYSAAGNEFI
jgi:hypothetical protein